MGRETRRTAVFDLMGKPARVYRFTEGQGAALLIARERGGVAMVSKLWAVIESLFVDRADWERFDQGITTGDFSLKDALAFITAVARYDWDKAAVEEMVPAEPFGEEG